MFSALAAPHGLIASALFSTANLCQPALEILVSCASRQAHQRLTHHLLRGVTEDPFRPPVPAHHPTLQCGADNRILRRTYDGGEQTHELVLRRRNCDFCRSLGDRRNRCCVIEHSSAAFPSFLDWAPVPGPALAHLLCRRLLTLIPNDRSAHSASASISGPRRVRNVSSPRPYRCRGRRLGTIAESCTLLSPGDRRLRADDGSLADSSASDQADADPVIHGCYPGSQPGNALGFLPFGP